jgi:diguanylate cyclase (GGDEF)-like protein
VGAAFVALHGAKHENQGDNPALLPVDALTGLANRRRFDAELEREWRCAAVERTPVGLLVLEVDNLKAYNDRHGREDGDVLLVAIAHAISANIGAPEHFAARYSGLELAVILPATDLAAASVVAERIEGAVRGLVYRQRTADALVTVNIGTASRIPQSADEPSMLVGAAFIALRNVKRQGPADAQPIRGAVKTLPR